MYISLSICVYHVFYPFHEIDLVFSDQVISCLLTKRCLDTYHVDRLQYHHYNTFLLMVNL